MTRQPTLRKAATVARSLIAIVCAVLMTPASAGLSLASPRGRETPPAKASAAATLQDDRPRRVDQQQEEKAIRLSADLVTILATVSDSAGNLVNDLSRDEFEIFEDNVVQHISALYREEQMPLRMVFLFDTSSSIRQRFEFEQRAAARFFRRVMRPGDEAAIFSVASDPRLEISFTSDVDKLTGTLERLKPGGATALYNSMIEAANYLRTSQGRHVIVVLSDGSDTASSATLAKAMAAVQKADAIIYAVHSTGIAPSANVQDLSGEFALKAMTEDTGGRAFFPPIYQDQKKEAQDLEDIYQRLSTEVRSQYLLTYYAKSQASGVKFRSIRVLAKRPGLQVRARLGYYVNSPL